MTPSTLLVLLLKSWKPRTLNQSLTIKLKSPTLIPRPSPVPLTEGAMYVNLRSLRLLLSQKCKSSKTATTMVPLALTLAALTLSSRPSSVLNKEGAMYVPQLELRLLLSQKSKHVMFKPKSMWKLTTRLVLVTPTPNARPSIVLNKEGAMYVLQRGLRLLLLQKPQSCLLKPQARMFSTHALNTCPSILPNTEGAL